MSEVVEHSTDNMSVVINIDDKVQRVCVSPVPKSLSLGKPEAFTPHFLGLGPYHHNRSNLTMTDELKLAAAKRMGKDNCEIRISDVQPFYHQDAFNSSHYEEDKLLRDITTDGLFLLALLDWSLGAQPQQDTYFLTGKYGMPLVNSSSVELTMDAVVRDVFMLENQIPTDILEQINKVICHSDVRSQNLGAKMLSFCENHCPLVYSEELSENEEHDHLLDLMYHLVAPKPSESDTKTNEKALSSVKSKGKTDKTVETLNPDQSEGTKC
ncbi:unnamed protein product [Sphenostylis stenocarpa]|uniref:Uncharacterized protein n=1 Tax=Sphenostylis stenocarpa TaxID=92480 RepID=A0AA86TRR3_9FABA|nr:unnamed protein product [Sphenostylis stenocarpa]